YGHGACVEQDDKGWDARKRAYCLKIQPATGSFARNLIYSTKPSTIWRFKGLVQLQILLKEIFMKTKLFTISIGIDVI
ncbi:hypothetical protein, partial [Escherichia coli]